MKKSGIFLVVIVLLSLMALVAYAYVSSSFTTGGKSYTIILTSEGFSPDKLTIKKGDTITFKTNMGKPFWPASDIHPTHGIYPEFDPKDAVMPDKTWSYKFEKIGNWRFHDHLAPYYTGTISVSE